MTSPVCVYTKPLFLLTRNILGLRKEIYGIREYTDLKLDLLAHSVTTIDTECARLCIQAELCKGYKQLELAQSVIGGGGPRFACDLVKETNSTGDPEMSRNVYLVPKRRKKFNP